MSMSYEADGSIVLEDASVTPPRSQTIPPGTSAADQAAAIAAFFPPPAPVVPDEVPLWALQTALQLAGKYAAINQTVSGWAGATDKTEVAAYFAWTMGNVATRQSAIISTFASQFGFASADIDALFVSAAAIAAASG